MTSLPLAVTKPSNNISIVNVRGAEVIGSTKSQLNTSPLILHHCFTRMPVVLVLSHFHFCILFLNNTSFYHLFWPTDEKQQSSHTADQQWGGAASQGGQQPWSLPQQVERLQHPESPQSLPEWGEKSCL